MLLVLAVLALLVLLLEPLLLSLVLLLLVWWLMRIVWCPAKAGEVSSLVLCHARLERSPIKLGMPTALVIIVIVVRPGVRMNVPGD